MKMTPVGITAVILSTVAGYVRIDRMCVIQSLDSRGMSCSFVDDTMYVSSVTETVDTANILECADITMCDYVVLKCRKNKPVKIRVERSI